MRRDVIVGTDDGSKLFEQLMTDLTYAGKYRMYSEQREPTAESTFYVFHYGDDGKMVNFSLLTSSEIKSGPLALEKTKLYPVPGETKISYTWIQD